MNELTKKQFEKESSLPELSNSQPIEERLSKIFVYVYIKRNGESIGEGWHTAEWDPIWGSYLFSMDQTDVAITSHVHGVVGTLNSKEQGAKIRDLPDGYELYAWSEVS